MSGRFAYRERLRWVSIAVAIALMMVLAVPELRHATADLLGFPGIRVDIGEPDDVPTTIDSIGSSLLLGERSDANDVIAETDLPLLAPVDARVGDDPEVYLNQFDSGTVVSLLYPASDALPEIGSTGVGLLLMAVDDGGSSYYLIAKRAIAEQPPQPVTVNGADALWIQGGVLTVEGGDPFWTYQRRSGNVLLWSDGRTTYRMESSLSLEDAIEIAESLQPVGTEAP